MYDTLKINNYVYEPLNFDKIEIIKEYTNKYTGELKAVKGNLNNLSIYLTNNYYNIEGSLSKYLYGNNFETLTLKDTEIAFKEIGNQLNIDLLNANLRKIHIGFNIETDNNIKELFNSFVGLNGYADRLQIHNELVFKNKSNELVFYDKKNELKEIQNINIERENNLIRIEARFNKNINNTFKSKIIVKDLFNKKFANNLITKLKDTYNKVEKREVYSMNEFNNNELKNILKLSPKDYERNLAKIGVLNLDSNKLFDMIDILQKSKVINNSNAKRLRDKTKEILNNNQSINIYEPYKNFEANFNDSISNFQINNDLL